MLNDPLKYASEALGKAIETEKRNRKLLDSIGPAIIQALSPVLSRIETAVSRMKVDVNPVIEVNPEIKAPEVIVNVPDFPEVIVPAPIVNYTPPAIHIPKMEMPDEMNIKGWVSLMGVSLEHPLPVQLRNADGSPVNLDITQIVSSSGGGRGIVKISGFDGSAYSMLQNGDGRIKVSTESGNSGLTDTELRATAVPVSQVSGANWSVIASATDFDIRDLDFAQDDVSIYQVSGANWSVNVASQDFTFDTKQVSGSIDSVKVTGFDTSVSATIIDSSGVGYSGSNPVPITIVSGALTSVISVGPILHDAADAGDAPVKIGGTAMQTNPTAVSDGDIIRFTGDDLGRQLMRPIQVRDLILTAYASLTGGTETTLLTAAAGTYLDLIYVMATNNSDAAITADLRAVSAGNIMTSIRIPANGTAGVSLPVPIPQDATGNAWTVDLPDVSGTTVTISALFSREI